MISLRPADHVNGLDVDRVGAHVEDEGSRAFAERFGCEELDRQVEQVACLNNAWHRKDPASAAKWRSSLNSAWHRQELPEVSR
jgi:hypothetical protein